MSSITGATGLSRRRFLGWSQAALAALGAAAPLVSTAQALVTTQNGDSADDYYEKLGVREDYQCGRPGNCPQRGGHAGASAACRGQGGASPCRSE